MFARIRQTIVGASGIGVRLVVEALERMGGKH